eukprot:15485721-Alexandrium_andersonii.AAC.1
MCIRDSLYYPLPSGRLARRRRPANHRRPTARAHVDVDGACAGVLMEVPVYAAAGVEPSNHLQVSILMAGLGPCEPSRELRACCPTPVHLYGRQESSSAVHEGSGTKHAIGLLP